MNIGRLHILLRELLSAYKKLNGSTGSNMKIEMSDKSCIGCGRNFRVMTGSPQRFHSISCENYFKTIPRERWAD